MSPVRSRPWPLFHSRRSISFARRTVRAFDELITDTCGQPVPSSPQRQRGRCSEPPDRSHLCCRLSCRTAGFQSTNRATHHQFFQHCNRRCGTHPMPCLVRWRQLFRMTANWGRCFRIAVRSSILILSGTISVFKVDNMRSAFSPVAVTWVACTSRTSRFHEAANWMTPRSVMGFPCNDNRFSDGSRPLRVQTEWFLPAEISRQHCPWSFAPPPGQRRPTLVPL